jgi:16S rRNA processing protein RimM
MSDADAIDSLVVVGRIGSPYGVKGWVNIQSFTQPIDNLLSYQPWMLQSSADKSWRPAPKHQVRPHKKGFVALFDGLVDRDQAASLTGTLIGVSRQSLATNAADDEYYWQDLTGCQVINLDGHVLGTVDHLLETGVHDVLVLTPAVQAPADILIPFIAPYVIAVDLEARTIRVEWALDW